MSSNPTLEQRVAALEGAVAGLLVHASTSAPTAFTPRAGWYRPTDVEKTAFAGAYSYAATLDIIQVSIPRLADGDIEGAFARAAFGFDANGVKKIWGTVDPTVARTFCDLLYDPHMTQANAESLLPGAGSMDKDGRAIAMMTGYATFPGLGGSGHVGIGGATNAAGVVAAQLAQKAGPVPPHVQGA